MDDKTKPEPENNTKRLAKVETSVCGLVLHNLEDMTTVAQVILQSGLAPDSFKSKEQIFVGLQAGAEMGLKPMQALNSIVVIHGKPTLWGDAALALVKKSGLLREYSEKVTGEGDAMVADVKSVRQDGDMKCLVETSFSVADAKTAGLWNKKGPWTTHPKRMLKYKARAFNLRDNFPDVLFGMHLTEEMYGEEPLPAPESDVLPRDERRSMAVSSSTVDTTRAPAKGTEPSIKEFEDVATGYNKETKAAPATEEKPEPAGVLEAVVEEKAKTETELVTFVCKECGQTFQYGKEEGKGVPCSCGKGLLVEVEKQPELVESSIEKKGDAAALYVEVNGMYVVQGGKNFIEFAAFVLCLDESEIAPSKLTDEQLEQIKAYIESSGVTIA